MVGQEKEGGPRCSVTTHLRTTLASTTTFIAFLREAFQVFRSRAPHRPDLFHRTNPGSRQFSPFQSFQLPQRPFARSTVPVAGIGGSKELPDLLLHRYPVVSGPPLDVAETMVSSSLRMVIAPMGSFHAARLASRQAGTTARLPIWRNLGEPSILPA